ncbi:hypothetical protein E2C01_067345 [Portunus trituberculatus]|uniref:Uncharacterized protein n=1 Tax=Portunus trituberculatus TaxID=210409 RepID=A0A5B7HTD1_PORTR|nr:hypothetical protein [Portunus trituberculatus]
MSHRASRAATPLRGRCCEGQSARVNHSTTKDYTCSLARCSAGSLPLPLPGTLPSSSPPALHRSLPISSAPRPPHLAIAGCLRVSL